jgi:hypothetical protein
MLKSLPLLIIALIAYNVIAIMAGVPLDRTVTATTLPSGALWRLSVGDLLILLGVALLSVEIIKASRVRRAGLDHGLSMVVFVIALLEFLLVAQCGTSVFVIIVALALIDVVSGFAVSLSTAQRDISVH